MRRATRRAVAGLSLLAGLGGQVTGQTPDPENPPGIIQFSRASYSVSESAGSAVITVVRWGGSRGPVVVTYTTGDGTATAGADYSASTGELAWGDGDAVSRTISVPIVNDGAREPTETLTITLRGASGVAPVGAPTTASLAIIDNDLAATSTGTVAVSDPVVDVAESQDAVVTVKRDGDTSVSVSLGWRLVGGSATASADYVPASGVLTFAPGETARRIRVSILNDAVDEDDETVRLVLESPTGGTVLGATAATIVIHDDDDAVPGAKGPFYLAEGATGFFDLEFALANPNPIPAPVTASFLEPGGAVTTIALTLPPLSRSTVRADAIPGLGQTAVSSVFDSTDDLPLVVERTMTWDRQDGYGAHTEHAGDGAQRHWFFAEGAQGFFDAYVLLANPQATTNTATVTFLREGESPIVRTYDLPPTSRTNVYAGDIPELANRAFGITVDFAEPGAAERSMYFGASPVWKGGHASSGAAAPATRWLLAEGATGPFFDTFVLVANPGAAEANVRFTYLLPGGGVITRQVVVAAHSRYTVNIEQEDDRLADTAVSTQVVSDLPVIVERSMYWPGTPAKWTEGHNSFGVTETGTKWGIADGRVGGPRGDETFILLANPNDVPARVTVTFLRTTGTPLTRSYEVGPSSRFTIHANEVAGLTDESFSAVVEATAPISVEHATYWSARGEFWAAGANATATRLP